MNLPFVIIGAGGHAAVLADTLLEAGSEVLGFTDINTTLHGTRRVGLPVLGGDQILFNQSPKKLRLVNGLGFVFGSGRTANVRARAQKRLEAQGWIFAQVCHPSAYVSRHAKLAADAQLLAGVIVQAGAIVGMGSIVNTAAIVEHDAIIGEWCHVASRATICGQTCIGNGCLIGAGAVLRQSLTLGDDTVVGAGAVVVRNSPGGETLCGVPARPYRINK
jgi:sugar O-acyltransferase (sialic acid O-acetyltransferase NeuD family)